MSTSVRVTTDDGTVFDLDGSEGESLMEVLRDAEIDDEIGLCGGCCSCATCHIYVDYDNSDEIPPISEDEDGMLSSVESRRDCSRLGCQIPLGGDLKSIVVTLPPPV